MYKLLIKTYKIYKKLFNKQNRPFFKTEEGSKKKKKLKKLSFETFESIFFTWLKAIKK